MFQKAKKCLQKGISLLEVMLSLSIIAIILVMATRYFFSASGTQKVNQIVTQIGALNSFIANWKNNQSSYAGVSATAIAANFVGDPSWDNTNYHDAFGDVMTIAPTAGNDGYTISMTLPSATVCSSLASALPANSSGTAGSKCDGAAYTYTGPMTST